jgi:hypothetical protein
VDEEEGGTWVQLELPDGLAPSQGKSDGGAPVGVAAVLLQLVCAPLPADVREARRQALDAATREAKEALEEVRPPARATRAAALRGASGPGRARPATRRAAPVLTRGGGGGGGGGAGGGGAARGGG